MLTFPLVTITLKRESFVFLYTCRFTSVFAVPFKYLGISFELKLLPDNVSLLAIIILSPALIPALILGPPLMGSITVTESLIILNCIPMPTNFPCILSCTSCKFSFGI